MPDSNSDMRANADGSVTLYSFPPFHDIDERTMTAIYRVTDTYGGEYDCYVRIAIIGCPMCGLRGGDADCSRCHGRGRIPIIDRTMSDVEIVQREQSLAQRRESYGIRNWT